MGSERRGVTGPDPTRFAGPDVLGRSVLVSVGQDPPEPWTCSPRVTVDSDAPDSATAHRLRAAWSRRERLVVELSGRLPPAAQALHRPWWELHPGVTLGGDVWRYLLTANTVDARDGDRFGFAPADRARALGARAAGGEPGDVVTAAGGVWCDGGPLDVFDPAALDEVGVVPAVNLDVGDLAALRLCDPDAALAEDQRRAVTHLGGGACIVAPAGSGKTRVLTERARWLVDGLGVSASAVCLVAYNVRARAEMQERTADLNGLEVRTLNSLALAVCNGTGPFAAPRHHARVSVINEREVRDLVEGLLTDRGVKRRRKAMTDPLAVWVEALNASRLGLRTPAEVERDYAPDVEGFAEIVPAFAEALHQRSVVDFDHQIIRCVDVLLSDPDARAAARRACGVLLVDEFQDLTPAHLLMVRLLAGPAASAFGVGDDDQTIYGYAGASPRWLIDYERWFPGADRHLLHVNYRCPPRVIDAATNLLSHNQHRITKRIEARHGHPDPAGDRSIETRDGPRRWRGCARTRARPPRRGLRQRGHRSAVQSQQHAAGTPDRLGRSRHREHRPSRAVVLGTHRGGRRAGMAETRYQRRQAARRGAGRRSTTTTPGDLTPSGQLDRRTTRPAVAATPRRTRHGRANL